MNADGDDKKGDALDEALERFVKAYVHGEQLDIDQFVEKYPQHETQIRRRVQSLCEVDALFDSIAEVDAGDVEEGSERNLVGQTVGSFVITEMIGRGGMGVVYLAHDTKLKRTVAIKGIPAKLVGEATAKIRFRREAELLASLNHPNIAVIHDIIEDKDDTAYLVLEYIPGETLSTRIAREPLTVEQALSLGGQIADAVSAAHKKGIVHQDLKPGNIKITPDGQVKVLDFGLARPFTADVEGAEATATQRHHIVGTPAYMSPEQARGNPTDRRTDIWSFGCILFQMLTGELAFQGKTATDTLASIIEREPDWGLLPEETPENIRTLLRRCLEKDPDRRLDNIANVTIQIDDALGKPLPASVRVVSPTIRRAVMIVGLIVIVALPAVGIWFGFYRQPPSREVRLVVLPFNDGGPAGQEWFADGVSSEITDCLSGIYGLEVIARYSAIQCRERGMSTREIARELEVDYILDGTVECKDPTDPNSALRIDLRLVDTSKDTQIWSRSFEGKRSELLDLQRQVAENMDLILLEQDRTWSRHIPTTSTEAHNLLLQGKAAKAAGTYHDSIPFYEKAIECDPNYVRALGELAWAHTHIYFFEDPSPERLVKAEVAARRAFNLLPDHPFVRLTMARYYYQGLLNYDMALEHLTKARELHPNHTWMLYWTGVVQQRRGDFDEALVNLTRAFELDPLSAHFACAVGDTLKVLRNYQDAEHYHESAIMQGPNNLNYYAQKAWLYLVWKGDLNAARAVLDEAITKTGESERVPRLMVLIDICAGKYPDALDRLSQADDTDIKPSWDMPYALRRAEVYGYLGQYDLARQQYEFARDALIDKVREYPTQAYYHSSLGIAYAGLGNEKKAIEHGICGRNLLPVEKDAWDGPLRVEDLARIYVMIGKYELALEQLAYLLSIPSRFSRQLLRLDPAWKPLRDHPRFTNLTKSTK